MRISDFKVKAEDYTGRDVSSLPDRPGLSATELKARFDSPAKVVLGGKFNQLIDALASAEDGASGAHYIASAPVDGLNADDGSAAINIGDQIAALQRNMGGAPGGGASVPTGQPILELPVAETLNVPCVVKLGRDGVRTPKYGSLRGSYAIRQIALENTNGTLSGVSIVPLFDDYYVVTYNRRTASAFVPTALIAKSVNGFIIEKHLIHAGTSSSSMVKLPTRVSRVNENTWLLCIVEPNSGASFIYAFSFDGEAYQQISKYTGVTGSLSIMENRFSFISNNTVLMRYFQSGTQGVVIKFEGGVLANGGAALLDSGNNDYPTVSISGNRCIFQATANTFRVIDINGLNITAHPIFTYTKTAFGFAGVSHTRFAAFSYASPNIEYAFMNISDSGAITAENSQRALGYGGGTPTAVKLSHEYIHIIHNIELVSNGSAKGNSVFKVAADGVTLMGTSLWPRYMASSEEGPIAEPVTQHCNPYTVSCNVNSGGTAMSGGLISCGTYLEDVACAGIALSTDGVSARVLVGPGAVTGFSGLRAGTVYSLGYDGKLLDAGNHPLALKIGIALDDETLWFYGN